MGKVILNKGNNMRKSTESQIRICPGASLVAQLVKNLPAMQETWV